MIRKLSRKSKQYSINQSRLYRVRSKRRLYEVLGFSEQEITRALSKGQYSVWDQEGREIQRPVGLLQQMHAVLAKHLSRVETPDYVHHRRKRSYITNAKEHVGEYSIVKTDISKYFPSITVDMIREMFVSIFDCSNDVAGILSRLCCYQHKHLPTGSEISGYVAFFSNLILFNEIAQLARARDCTFTLYVDDLTISGFEASRKLMYEVRLLIRKRGLRTKQRKTKYYPPTSAKVVTGVIIKGNFCYLPNAQHLELKRLRTELNDSFDELEKARLRNVIKGKQVAAKQISKANLDYDDYAPTLIYPG